MPCDYGAIKEDNVRRYGTEIGRIGQMLLADRYDDRTHFIFELLQNAEDALKRRRNWNGQRAVKFDLVADGLRVSHYGLPFDEQDVRGICGIAESHHDLTDIGRFGIGFKSVYAVTGRPEVHSGEEEFAIENFVWPVAAPAVDRTVDETVIQIPLNTSDPGGHKDVAAGLGRIGASTLLFLRQIKEIHWRIEAGRSGLYLRESTDIDAGVRRVTLIGQEEGAPDVDESWLLFSRAVTDHTGCHAGYVEIAFSLAQDEETDRETIQQVDRSPLVVFFPTVLETHFGFLVQGPYRTTPSRDNVPRIEPWNQKLVRETSDLLVQTLMWLRDQNLLDTAALNCMPIDRTRFGESNMFAPLFAALKEALKCKRLLPRFASGYAAVDEVRLARTQELRELVNPEQLGVLLGQNGDLSWLSGDITQDRTPELRQYVIRELEIAEITPEGIVSKFNKVFLEAESDDWVRRLYEFLGGQTALLRQGTLSGVALVRLNDGTHVPAKIGGQPQAFLPGVVATGFPTVRSSVCGSPDALKFLQSLGLTEPDIVDDIVHNVAPKYQGDVTKLALAENEADIRRILKAFSTDSKVQRERLVSVLKNTRFVLAIDTGDRRKWWATPGKLYLATERLKELFAGVAGVLLVDDTLTCLRGEEIRQLLEDCGATRYFRLQSDSSLPWEERGRLREKSGHAETSGYSDQVEDYTLAGLNPLLDVLPTLTDEQRRNRARFLWEEIISLEERRGKAVFTGTYKWSHHGKYQIEFDAAFIRKLNQAEWVPTPDGRLERPEFVQFDTLGWKPDPFLQSKIQFKPPVIESLAREAGIEPGVLDLLKKLGVTTVAELRGKLGITDHDIVPGGTTGASPDVDKALKDILGAGTPGPTPPVPGPTDEYSHGAGAGGGQRTGGGAGAASATKGVGAAEGTGAQGGSSGHKGDHAAKRSPGSAGGRPFISYVATYPDEEEPDPDGLEHEARIALEEKAIILIRQREPRLERTPKGNPGFDLFEPGGDGQLSRWVEVKAMTGDLQDRPVGLSRTQFECAQEHGERFWLYVVEHAGNEGAHIVRIQDPAGKARTFTFDHGWLSIADEGAPEADGKD